jgi:hypothetical protein
MPGSSAPATGGRSLATGETGAAAIGAIASTGGAADASSTGLACSVSVRGAVAGAARRTGVVACARGCATGAGAGSACGVAARVSGGGGASCGSAGSTTVGSGVGSGAAATGMSGTTITGSGAGWIGAAASCARLGVEAIASTAASAVPAWRSECVEWVIAKQKLPVAAPRSRAARHTGKRDHCFIYVFCD